MKDQASKLKWNFADRHLQAGSPNNFRGHGLCAKDEDTQSPVSMKFPRPTLPGSPPFSVEAVRARDSILPTPHATDGWLPRTMPIWRRTISTVICPKTIRSSPYMPPRSAERSTPTHWGMRHWPDLIVVQLRKILGIMTLRKAGSIILTSAEYSTAALRAPGPPA